MKINTKTLTLIFVIIVVGALVAGTLQILNQSKHEGMPGMDMSPSQQMERAQGRGK